MWQAHRVAELLRQSGVEPSLVVIETAGDRDLGVPLERLGGQGIFVKEVQAAVVAGEADAAVHSAKDLPASAELSAPGLLLAAVPERADQRDVLVGGRLDSLPVGALVATGSARRRVQLADLRHDLTFAGLRGNIATRLTKVGESGVAAVVVAKAALDRLDWTPPTALELEVLEPSTMVPQIGQGALAVECREDDERTRRSLASIDDLDAHALVNAERAFLAELGGGCTQPVGAHARRADLSGADPAAGPALITLSGMIASTDGLVVLRHELSGERPEELGRALARYLLDDAGGAVLGDWDAPSKVAG
jgi:hydroxymethylbilane synthase